MLLAMSGLNRCPRVWNGEGGDEREKMSKSEAGRFEIRVLSLSQVHIFKISHFLRIYPGDRIRATKD